MKKDIEIIISEMKKEYVSLTTGAEMKSMREMICDERHAKTIYKYILKLEESLEK